MAPGPPPDENSHEPSIEGGENVLGKLVAHVRDVRGSQSQFGNDPIEECGRRLRHTPAIGGPDKVEWRDQLSEGLLTARWLITDNSNAIPLALQLSQARQRVRIEVEPFVFLET
jgi:hypothetical protein